VLLLALGPGMMVMLADTDAGSIVTAAQSGARWGYRLLFLQLALAPILYLVMELTVRLGIATGTGHAELIREHFEAGWALVSVGTLLVSAVGALVTEFAGVAGVGRLFGLPPRGSSSSRSGSRSPTPPPPRSGGASGWRRACRPCRRPGRRSASLSSQRQGRNRCASRPRGRHRAGVSRSPQPGACRR
jgi:hypothetical protein